MLLSCRPFCYNEQSNNNILVSATKLRVEEAKKGLKVDSDIYKQKRAPHAWKILQASYPQNFKLLADIEFVDLNYFTLSRHLRIVVWDWHGHGGQQRTQRD